MRNTHVTLLVLLFVFASNLVSGEEKAIPIQPDHKLQARIDRLMRASIAREIPDAERGAVEREFRELTTGPDKVEFLRQLLYYSLTAPSEKLRGRKGDITDCFVSRGLSISVMSPFLPHGGAATFVLTNRLANVDRVPVQFTSYVDAVMEEYPGDMRQELRRPGSAYHMNHYQRGSLADGWLDGGPSAPAANWELDVETTQWGANATHFIVDDYGQVRTEIQDQLRANLPNR